MSALLTAGGANLLEDEVYSRSPDVDIWHKRPQKAQNILAKSKPTNLKAAARMAVCGDQVVPTEEDDFEVQCTQISSVQDYGWHRVKSTTLTCMIIVQAVVSVLLGLDA